MPDRLALLESRSDRFTGIDFVQVVDHCDQKVLRIYFLTDPRELDPLFSSAEMPPTTTPVEPLDHGSFRIESPLEGVEPVPLDEGVPILWAYDADAERMYVEITLERAGDFAPYTLTIDDPWATPTHPSRVDPYFNGVAFDFKVGCDDADCEAPLPDDCPPEPDDDVELDYLARDFTSLKGALTDFAARRMPDWTGRLEADPLVMLIEVLAATGDELSYIQDRYAREAFLETATERRSLRKMARLVDYEIHDGHLATTWLLFEVEGGSRSLAPGTPVWALSAAGPRVRFEVGGPLGDGTTHLAHGDWNLGARAPFYWADDGARILPCGATDFRVEAPIDGIESWEGATPDDGRMVYFELPPADPSEPSRRHLARVAEVVRTETGDSVHTDPLTGTGFHHLRLRREDALPFAAPQDRLLFGANLVPAVAGETRHALFRCGDPEPGDPGWMQSTVERAGPAPVAPGDDPTGWGPIARLAERDRIDDGEEPAPLERPAVHLYSLPGTDTDGLGFLGPHRRDTVPELLLFEIDDADVPSLPAGSAPVAGGLLGAEWQFRPTLLGSTDDARHFTLEDGTWRRVVGYRRQGEEVVHRDYASGRGYTVRFGEGEFAQQPRRGQAFYAVYRLGAGAEANVGADRVRALSLPEDPSAGAAPAWVRSVRNPFGVTTGLDPESLTDVRMLAPEAWQAEQLFAVRPEDYAEQAERLDWVQRASGTLRWTGSWHSTMVATDPRGALSLSAERRRELVEHLECVRQAGRDVRVREPRFLSLELSITVCVEPWAYPAQVAKAVEERLVGRPRPGEPLPFFHPDRFTFGTLLRRASLEAAVHDVRGVRSVLSMRVGVRGVEPARDFTELLYPSAATHAGDFVLRLDADPRRPERGSLLVHTEGGA